MMKNDRDRAVSFIDSMDKQRQIAFLARLIYELTLAGRTTYSMESSGLDKPLLLREVNELQHKLSAQIMNIALDTSHRLPSPDLVDLFLDPKYSDESVSSEVKRSFVDAIAGFLV